MAGRALWRLCQLRAADQRGHVAAVRRAAADPDPRCLDPAAAYWREGRRMTGWIAIILLVLAAFLVAVFVLKLERRSWTTLGAVLPFGLAGSSLPRLEERRLGKEWVVSFRSRCEVVH